MPVASVADFAIVQDNSQDVCGKNCSLELLYRGLKDDRCLWDLDSGRLLYKRPEGVGATDVEVIIAASLAEAMEDFKKDCLAMASTTDNGSDRAMK